jgi:hypothetical protein
MDKLTNWDRMIALLLVHYPGLELRVLVVGVKNDEKDGVRFCE